ncbi:MAG: DUF2358 domain-containing protein [Pseudanabaenaceae cyanobacterium bins.68]|nr:DUF2358 domain-containing protein [Pseudanabaenaceae cyanobacterium bins.68]
MELLEIIKQDYARFPQAQTYGVYHPQVYFQDPVYQFRGLKRYQEMIAFITFWFKNLRLELHEIELGEGMILTRWTMSWNAPLPWQPRVSVSGRSELEFDQAQLITAHRDFWDCSRWDLIKQHFRF